MEIEGLPIRQWADERCRPLDGCFILLREAWEQGCHPCFHTCDLHREKRTLGPVWQGKDRTSFSESGYAAKRL
jgi:hypothetical protein